VFQYPLPAEYLRKKVISAMVDAVNNAQNWVYDFNFFACQVNSSSSILISRLELVIGGTADASPHADD
jgi:hypothetical protein